MRMRDWEKKMANKELKGGHLFMLNVVFKSLSHGNTRHRNWLKRKCLELGDELDNKFASKYLMGVAHGQQRAK